MKSLSQQISETQDALRAKNIDFKEAIKDATTEEQRLNNLKSLATKHGITESRRTITRNNGRGTPPEKSNKLTRIDESALRHIARGVSIREAYLYASDCSTDLKNNQLPEHVITVLTGEWRAYNRRLSEVDAKSLAVRGLRP